ncbi:MAG: ParA family protein [Oscillospiraceae bacterium]|nr:ParA family protein [Oscillospiraceae bacterium]
MGKIVAVTNQKGGVGKTTTCINLAYSLKTAGKRVLLCDMDPQGNATSGSGVEKTKASPTVYDVLIRGVPAEDAVISGGYFDIMPSNQSLSGAGVELVGAENRAHVLRAALSSLSERYDITLIDCPPSLEMLTLNALCAADSVLIPVQCEYFALEGIADLMATVRMIKRELNTGIEIEGVLLTMYDARTNFSAQVAAEIKRYFKNKVYTISIPRNVRISEAPSHGMPVMVYERSSRGAQAYNDFCAEFIKRVERR